MATQQGNGMFPECGSRCCLGPTAKIWKVEGEQLVTAIPTVTNEEVLLFTGYKGAYVEDDENTTVCYAERNNGDILFVVGSSSVWIVQVKYILRGSLSVKEN